MSHNRYLLVTRAGPQSLHNHWLEMPAERRFDLFVSAYSPDVPPVSGDGVQYEYRPGSKVAGYAAFLREHRALWQRYDYVALFDDDLMIGTGALNRLFALAQDHDLKIAQPALSRHSHFTYAALLQHPRFALRYMTFIEMMCPIFRVDALTQIEPLFDLGFESGIDIIWSNMLGAQPHDMAVIDAVTVDHMRRVGSGKAANGFTAGRRYEDDIEALLTRFDCPWLPCVPFGAVEHNGRRIAGRHAYLRNALALVQAVPAHAPMKQRARSVAVYWKHLLTAPARTHKLAWPSDGNHSEILYALGRETAAQEVEQA